MVPRFVLLQGERLFTGTAHSGITERVVLRKPWLRIEVVQCQEHLLAHKLRLRQPDAWRSSAFGYEEHVLMNTLSGKT